MYANPSISSWDSSTSTITVNHSDFINPCTGVKVGGTNYKDFRVYEWSSGYAYNSTTLSLRKWDGTKYSPQNGDWFTFQRQGKKGSHTTLDNTLFESRISNWTFLPDPTNLFYNFQFIIIGK